MVGFENIVLRLLLSCLSPCPGGCRVGGHQYAERAPTASCRHVVPLNLDIAPAAAAVRSEAHTGQRCAPPRSPLCVPLRAPAMPPVGRWQGLLPTRPLVVRYQGTRPAPVPPPPLQPPVSPSWAQPEHPDILLQWLLLLLLLLLDNLLEPASPPWRSLPPSSRQPPCSYPAFTILHCWHTR